MTNQEVLQLNQALNQLGKMSGVKFAYAVSKNVANIKAELEALDKSFEASEAYKAFDAARVKLAEEHAKKGEDGSPLKIEKKDSSGNVISGSYIMDDQAAFDAAFEELKLEHKEAVEAREKQVEEYLELLKEESKIGIYKVFIDDVPKEITVEQMYGISPIISELPIF